MNILKKEEDNYILIIDLLTKFNVDKSYEVIRNSTIYIKKIIFNLLQLNEIGTFVFSTIEYLSEKDDTTIVEVILNNRIKEKILNIYPRFLNNNKIIFKHCEQDE